MVVIKRYFLYGLMVSSFSLLAMENNINQRDIDRYVKDVGDMVDLSFLNFNEDLICGFPHIKSLIGSFLSVCKGKLLTLEKAISDINLIKAYFMQKVPKELRKPVFTEIIKQHWYVHYLIQTLVNKRCEELENVKGSTIDALYNPAHVQIDVVDNDVREMVYGKAMAQFFVKAGIHNPLDCVPMNKFEAVHSIVLYGHTNDIHLASLVMSLDGKYLKSMDRMANEIVWDMQKGARVNVANLLAIAYDTIKWTPGFWVDRKMYGVIDKTDTYYAVSTCRQDFQNDPAIVLFKRPQDVSYMCQKAFENSKNNQELIALRDSEIIKSIEGFPQDNLKKLIVDQINQ